MLREKLKGFQTLRMQVRCQTHSLCLKCLSRVFVPALQKPEHAGVDTPNRNQSRLKLESVKHRGVQVTGLPSKHLDFLDFLIFSFLPFVLGAPGFSNGGSIAALSWTHAVLHVRVLTTEGRNRASQGCWGAPGEHMWISFRVGPFCKEFHFFSEGLKPFILLSFCVGTQWSEPRKRSPAAWGLPC